jgi:hypothetical protein
MYDFSLSLMKSSFLTDQMQIFFLEGLGWKSIILFMSVCSTISFLLSLLLQLTF